MNSEATDYLLIKYCTFIRFCRKMGVERGSELIRYLDLYTFKWPKLMGQALRSILTEFNIGLPIK
jgi:hypothetical protein